MQNNNIDAFSRILIYKSIYIPYNVNSSKSSNVAIPFSLVIYPLYEM